MKIINQFFYGFTQYIFHSRNSHSFLQVLVWWVWSTLAKIKYTSNHLMHYRSEVDISEKGICIIGKSCVDKLSALSSEYLDSEKIIDGYCGLSRRNNIILAPLIFDILMEHKKNIELCFGSYFRVNWFEIQKIVASPQVKQDGGSSFGWHTDDVPSPVFKLFIYLTDCKISNGAFRAFNYQATDLLIKRGMLRSAQPGKAREAVQGLVNCALEDQLNVVEGAKGAVFIFDNNLIHKGTMPTEGERIIVSMELMPSMRPLEYGEFCYKCDQPIDKYFPRNPFDDWRGDWRRC